MITKLPKEKFGFTEDEKVTLDSGMKSERRGTVHGFYKDWAIVQLTDGFWAENKIAYFSMIVVDPGNLRRGW